MSTAVARSEGDFRLGAVARRFRRPFKIPGGVPTPGNLRHRRVGRLRSTTCRRFATRRP